MAFETISTDGGEKFKFEKEGETLTGFYLGTDILEILGKAVCRHNVKTPTGVMSPLGSHALDAGFAKLTPGTYVRVTFTGKKPLKGGKTIKNFTFEIDRDMKDDGTTVANIQPATSMADKVAALKNQKVSA